MRQREADPVDAEQRDRHADRAGLALEERQAEQQRHGRDGDEQDLELAAVLRREQQPGEREQPREAHGMGAVVHRVELVHADGARAPGDRA